MNVYRWADRFRLSQGEQRCDGSSFGKKRDAETLRNESEGFMKQSCSAVLIDGLQFFVHFGCKMNESQSETDRDKFYKSNVGMMWRVSSSLLTIFIELY